jgi:hypothetical protein
MSGLGRRFGMGRFPRQELLDGAQLDGACNVGAVGGVLLMSCKGPAGITKRVARKMEITADLVRGDISLSGQGCSSHAGEGLNG